MKPETLFYIIVGILIFNYVLDLVLDYLDDTMWSDKLPPEAEGIYDEEKYQKSRNYDKEQGKLGKLKLTTTIILMMLMLFADGFAWVDNWVRQYTNHPILMTLGFFTVLTVVSDFVGTPFALYSTFVIEEKFGFNKITWKTYLADKVKSMFLGAIIGGGLISLVVWIYQSTGSNFWWMAWLVVSGFSLFMAMFYTSIIVPVFNKLTPLENGELRYAIEGYAKEVGFKLNNIFVIDGSKRSSKANAYFSGLGPNKKIVLYDTLIANHTKSELVAILAHEVGHYKKKHIWQTLLLGVMQTGIMFYVLGLLIDSSVLAKALGAGEQSFHLGILVFGILYSPLSQIMNMGMSYVSRKNEYEADAFAKETYNGDALQSALKKLSVDNLSNLTPHPINVFLSYSHPTLLQRLASLK